MITIKTLLGLIDGFSTATNVKELEMHMETYPKHNGLHTAENLQFVEDPPCGYIEIMLVQINIIFLIILLMRSVSKMYLKASCVILTEKTVNQIQIFTEVVKDSGLSVDLMRLHSIVRWVCIENLKLLMVFFMVAQVLKSLIKVWQVMISTLFFPKLTKKLLSHFVRNSAWQNLLAQLPSTR